ncbi:MAG: hypothetical protein IPL43_02545 [Micropruina sp.]|nr:hypothetical protein [Micropruina sp.]
MAINRVLGGRSVLGGISYEQFEDLTVLLGYGADNFTVESTHAGTTTVDAGPGNDLLVIRSIAGHTRIVGGPRQTSTLLGRSDDDIFLVGTPAGLLDELDALLVLDGGVGFDTASLDDSGDSDDSLGWLTQTTLTGLDLLATSATDLLGRPLDQLYSVTPGAGSFTIVLSQVVGSVATGIGAVTFSAGVTAEHIRAALQLLLFPQTTGADPGVSMTCGQVGDTRCAASVYVWQVGGDFLIGFRGEVNENPLLPISIKLDALGASSAAADRSRREGINYYGLETLNLALGSGDDVLNVRGTLPVTNIALADGDDRSTSPRWPTLP